MRGWCFVTPFSARNMIFPIIVSFSSCFIVASLFLFNKQCFFRLPLTILLIAKSSVANAIINCSSLEFIILKYNAAVQFWGMIWSVSSMSSVCFTFFLGSLMTFQFYYSYPQAQHQVTGENSAGIFFSLSLFFKIVVFCLLVMLKSCIIFGFTCH